MISFNSLWVFLLLPLPFLVVWLSPVHRQRASALRFPFFNRIVDAAGIKPNSGAIVLGKTRLQILAAAVIWSLLITGMANPEFLGAPVERTQSARDLILAIDISASMNAVDFTATDGNVIQRLEAVQQVVNEFVAAREGDRVALIVFGSRAYVQAPLTNDLETIIALMSQTEVGMAGPQTAVGDAIGLAIRTFESSDIEQRLLIVLSDGSDTASRMSLVNAAEIANDRNVRIFTIGVGDPNATGDDRVDLQALEDVARITRGQYFFADDETALQAIYKQIDTLAPSEFETQSYRPRTSLFHIPFILAALIGVLTLTVLQFSRNKQVTA